RIVKGSVRLPSSTGTVLPTFRWEISLRSRCSRSRRCTAMASPQSFDTFTKLLAEQADNWEEEEEEDADEELRPVNDDAELSSPLLLPEEVAASLDDEREPILCTYLQLNLPVQSGYSCSNFPSLGTVLHLARNRSWWV
ncbi:unnamed protein product, partial [Trypanosoma congolense IL3000]